MTPDTLSKSNTEHAHQRAFFQWLNFATRYGFDTAKGMCLQQTTGRQSIKDLKAGRIIGLPELNLMHAIPNGGYRRGSEASKLKAEGVKAGVLDTFLPVSKQCPIHPGSAHMFTYSGLYIEFKDQKRRAHADGGLSVEQVKFMRAVRDQGYCARVAYTWREAANLTMQYYGEEIRFDTWGK